VDWLVEANVSQKCTVSIFRVEVTMLGNRDYIGWQEQKSEGRGQSGWSKVEIEPGQWGDSKQVSVEGGEGG
jgi:hypothetical protein